MSKKIVPFLFVSGLLVTAPGRAQFPAKSVALIYESRSKPGADFEAAAKAHFAWHKQQNDTWSYSLFQVISGERTGEYIGGTFGHDWKDFDEHAKFEQADMANARETLFPAIESFKTSYWLYRRDLSLNVPEQSGPDPLVEVITFYLKPDAWMPAVEDVIKKVNDAAKKSNYSIHGGWYQLLNGDDGSQLVLTVGHKTWADMQPPNKTFEAMLAEVYGADATHSLFKTFDGSLRRSRSEIIQYRPDLSYLPEPAK